LIAAVSLMIAGCGGGGGGSSSNISQPAQYASVPAGTPASPGHGSEAANGHFERLNEVRTAMGLPAVVWNEQLASAARCHANYLKVNNQFGHSESAQNPAFCGEGFAQRESRAGYNATIDSELIVSGDAQTRADGRNLMDAMLTSPGHRIVALAHEFAEAGVSDSPLTTELAARQKVAFPDYRVLAYPYNGQTGIATGYAPGAETPNPLPGVSITGYPITLHAGLFVKFTVTSVQLLNQLTGTTQAIVGPSAIGQTQSAFVFFPAQTLDPQTSYRFTATVMANGVEQKISSVFTTTSY
jgi:hypothetical protein